MKDVQDAMGTRQVRRPFAQVREREVLRVAGDLDGADSLVALKRARAIVLRWAEEQIGDPLPIAAGDGKHFEHFLGGRTCVGASVDDPTTTLWALRVDRPDSSVAQRIWTTEVVVGRQGSNPAMFSLRLLASSPEQTLNIDPAVPGLVQQIAKDCGLGHGGVRFQAEPYTVKDQQDVDQLIEALVSPERSIPFIVFSRGAKDSIRSFQAEILARSMMGLARVILVPAPFSAVLAQTFGKGLAALNGAARIYMPGFSDDANPYRHRQFLPVAAETGTGWDGAMSAIRWAAASESIKRRQLGADVLAFAAVREFCLDQERERLRQTGSNVQDQLQAAHDQITALKEDLRKSNAETAQWMSEYGRSDEESKNFELQLRGASNRVQQLLSQIQTRGESPDSQLRLPEDWAEFGDWVDESLSGRVALSSRARREVKAPAYESVQTAARSLLWLANDYREARMGGGTGDLRVPLEEGVHNDRCGADSFEFTWRSGEKVLVEWHVKGGGNTREPRRCLRIYYFWDEAQQVVVVASMPGHLRTGAT